MFFSSLVAFFVTTPGSPCSFSVSMWPAVWPVLVHSAPRASHPLNSPTTFLVSYLLGPYSPTFWVWVLHEILLPFAASSTASPVSSFLALVNGSVVVSGAHSNLCSSVAAPAFLVQPLFLNAPTPTAVLLHCPNSGRNSAEALDTDSANIAPTAKRQSPTIRMRFI